MKKLLIMTALIGVPAQAGTLQYTYKGCPTAEECEVFDEGEMPFEDSEKESLAWLFTKAAEEGFAKVIKKTKKNKKTSAVASAIGVSYDVASSAINALREGAVAAGYTSFKGELSGPSGSVEISINLNSGHSAISFRPGGGGSDFSGVGGSGDNPVSGKQHK